MSVFPEAPRLANVSLQMLWVNGYLWRLALLTSVVPLCLLATLFWRMEWEPTPGWASPAFEMHVTVLEAREDGPVTLLVSLKYLGMEPIAIATVGADEGAGPPGLSASEPFGWKRKETSGFGPFFRNVGLCTMTMQPGEERRKILRLEQIYQRIPAGTARLALTWNIRVRDPQRPSITVLIASPTAEIDVDVESRYREAKFVALVTLWVVDQLLFLAVGGLFLYRRMHRTGPSAA